jgi:hypothetical protein
MMTTLCLRYENICIRRNHIKQGRFRSHKRMERRLLNEGRIENSGFLPIDSNGRAQLVFRHQTHYNFICYMKNRKQSVSVCRTFPVPLERLWAAASHPARLSGDVAMLRDFQAPEILGVGSPLAETHTILGWPQRYAGRITQFERAMRWAMRSRPQSRGPCPLPHNVCYEFEHNESGSTLTIKCDFKCGGLLAFPFVPRIVAWFMKLTIANLLSAIENKVMKTTVPQTA